MFIRVVKIDVFPSLFASGSTVSDQTAPTILYLKVYRFESLPSYVL